MQQSPSLWLPESLVPGGEAGRSQGWRGSVWQLRVQEMTPGQWRSCEHGSGGWWLQPSTAGGCAEEAGKYRCDYGDQLARHTYSPAPRAGKSAHTLMSTETWQLACKHFGLGPSVPCSCKTCCHGPSAHLAETLRQDKHAEQGAHTFPGIAACLLRQSKENNYFSKEHCVITTLSIISS